jgi:DNA ligase (NAD+)
MNKKNIEKNYSEKIKSIQKHNFNYYNKDKPIISDQEFDLLKKEIINLENKYQFLKSDQSPTKTVGFEPSKNFKKIKHKIPMLSLGNAFNEEDLNNFEKKIINFLSLKNIDTIEYSV